MTPEQSLAAFVVCAVLFILYALVVATAPQRPTEIKTCPFCGYPAAEGYHRDEFGTMSCLSL